MDETFGRTDDGPTVVPVLAVPDDAVGELVDAGLVEEMLTFRGAVLDAVINVGVDSAALVTLAQAPGTLHEFATWLVSRAKRQGKFIQISAERAGRRVELRVTGDFSAEAVTAFLVSALPDSIEDDSRRNMRDD
jgi:hypothetical protein